MSNLKTNWLTQSLPEQLAFYAKYHQQNVNQLIHMIFVPLIYFTVLVWLAYTPTKDFSFNVPARLGPVTSSVLGDHFWVPSSRLDVTNQVAWLEQVTGQKVGPDDMIDKTLQQVKGTNQYVLGFKVDGAAIVSFAYIAYYMVLDPLAGASWAASSGIPLYVVAEKFIASNPQAWKIALGCHLLGWAMQVLVGHMMFEKNRPAILDSLFQTIVLAPLFVWYHILFALGYRQSLMHEINLRVLRDKQE